MDSIKSKIELLRKETGKDYAVCEKALKKSKYDTEKAKELLKKKDKVNDYTDNIYNYLVGQRCFRFQIKHEKSDIINVPIVIPILILLLLPMRSYVISLGLLLLIVLNCSLCIEINENEAKEHLNTFTVIKEDENDNTYINVMPQNKIVYEQEEINLKKDKEGYSYLTIE